MLRLLTPRSHHTSHHVVMQSNWAHIRTLKNQEGSKINVKVRLLRSLLQRGFQKSTIPLAPTTELNTCKNSSQRRYGKNLELYTTVLPAVFLVLVFCWYQICWIFGISVGIVPPFFVYFPPFLPPFFQKGVELLKKGAIAPLLRKKGGTAPFLIPKCTDRVFLRYGIGNTGEIPTEYRPKIPNWYTTLVFLC